jgi:hypothetical protein
VARLFTHCDASSLARDPRPLIEPQERRTAMR